MEWRKSTRCSSGGCLEVGADFRKSTRSDSANSCVEAARPRRELVLVRDSKLGEDSPVLRYGLNAWSDFIDWVKALECTDAS